MMKEYHVVSQLGCGSYGSAHLAHHIPSNTKRVIKRIRTAHLAPQQLQEARQEVQVLALLIHPYITEFRGSCEEDGCLLIAMDYCGGGDLHSLINGRGSVLFPEDRVLDWFVQLCLAVKYIHDRKILHRDIKAQNIFLTDDGKVRLGDFGIAKVLNSSTDLARTCIGTPYYLSPEMCENKPYNNKSDIWALGCVLYEMLTLKHAFEANNMKALILKIVKGIYPPVPQRYSRDLRLLVAQIFQRLPQARPSISEILRKPFILKRVPRFISGCEEEELMASLIKRKCTFPASARRISVSKRPQDITDPSAKYGASLSVQKRILYKTPAKSGVKSTRHSIGSAKKTAKTNQSRVNSRLNQLNKNKYPSENSLFFKDDQNNSAEKNQDKRHQRRSKSVPETYCQNLKKGQHLMVKNAPSPKKLQLMLDSSGFRKQKKILSGYIDDNSSSPKIPQSQELGYWDNHSPNIAQISMSGDSAIQQEEFGTSPPKVDGWLVDEYLSRKLQAAQQKRKFLEAIVVPDATETSVVDNDLQIKIESSAEVISNELKQENLSVREKLSSCRTAKIDPHNAETKIARDNAPTAAQEQRNGQGAIAKQVKDIANQTLRLRSYSSSDENDDAMCVKTSAEEMRKMMQEKLKRIAQKRKNKMSQMVLQRRQWAYEREKILGNSSRNNVNESDSFESSLKCFPQAKESGEGNEPHSSNIPFSENIHQITSVPDRTVSHLGHNTNKEANCSDLTHKDEQAQQQQTNDDIQVEDNKIEIRETPNRPCLTMLEKRVMHNENNLQIVIENIGKGEVCHPLTSTDKSNATICNESSAFVDITVTDNGEMSLLTEKHMSPQTMIPKQVLIKDMAVTDETKTSVLHAAENIKELSSNEAGFVKKTESNEKIIPSSPYESLSTKNERENNTENLSVENEKIVLYSPCESLSTKHERENSTENLSVKSSLPTLPVTPPGRGDTVAKQSNGDSGVPQDSEKLTPSKRARWGDVHTAGLEISPLETTGSEMETTTSSDLVTVFREAGERRLWRRECRELVTALSEADIEMDKVKEHVKFAVNRQTDHERKLDGKLHPKTKSGEGKEEKVSSTQNLKSKREKISNQKNICTSLKSRSNERKTLGGGKESESIVSKKTGKCIEMNSTFTVKDGLTVCGKGTCACHSSRLARGQVTETLNAAETGHVMNSTFEVGKESFEKEISALGPPLLNSTFDKGKGKCNTIPAKVPSGLNSTFSIQNKVSTNLQLECKQEKTQVSEAGKENNQTKQLNTTVILETLNTDAIVGNTLNETQILTTEDNASNKDIDDNPSAPSQFPTACAKQTLCETLNIEDNISESSCASSTNGQKKFRASLLDKLRLHLSPQHKLKLKYSVDSNQCSGSKVPLSPLVKEEKTIKKTQETVSVVNEKEDLHLNTSEAVCSFGQKGKIKSGLASILRKLSSKNEIKTSSDIASGKSNTQTHNETIVLNTTFTGSDKMSRDSYGEKSTEPAEEKITSNSNSLPMLSLQDKQPSKSMIVREDSKADHTEPENELNCDLIETKSGLYPEVTLETTFSASNRTEKKNPSELVNDVPRVNIVDDISGDSGIDTQNTGIYTTSESPDSSSHIHMQSIPFSFEQNTCSRETETQLQVTASNGKANRESLRTSPTLLSTLDGTRTLQGIHIDLNDVPTHPQSIHNLANSIVSDVFATARRITGNENIQNVSPVSTNGIHLNLRSSTELEGEVAADQKNTNNSIYLETTEHKSEKAQKQTHAQNRVNENLFIREEITESNGMIPDGEHADKEAEHMNDDGLESMTFAKEKNSINIDNALKQENQHLPDNNIQELSRVARLEEQSKGKFDAGESLTERTPPPSLSPHTSTNIGSSPARARPTVLNLCTSNTARPAFHISLVAHKGKGNIDGMKKKIMKGKCNVSKQARLTSKEFEEVYFHPLLIEDKRCKHTSGIRRHDNTKYSEKNIVDCNQSSKGISTRKHKGDNIDSCDSVPLTMKNTLSTTGKGILPVSNEETEDLAMLRKSMEQLLEREEKKEKLGKETCGSLPSDVWHLDKSGVVVPEVGGATGSGVYAWIEEQRARLEEDLGLDLFLNAYHRLEEAQEREGCMVGGAVGEVEELLGPPHAHLTPHILQLVVADALYHN
ncbi:hypothetical protein Pcinc_010471 [Petrolisthes cinctipes]|uniref:non-specific serine/threonine protein kinase n=1 Tax=Petrolisthes cinctipes TaxID=88211 RepID=A0AAE1KTK1_PETCI|nr:hypothetical protein Pcinc_010471 [Petrolisthes cinctipes]